VRISGVIGALIVLIALAGCGSSSDSGGGTKTVVTVIEKQPANPGGNSGSNGPGKVSDGGPGGGSSGGKITLPNEVGNQLQAAQDDLQAHGLYNLSNEDATGQGRFLIYDRNWKVVSQSPPAGTKVGPDEHITLSAKKYTDP
jgi:hypothetical protein